MSQLYFKPVLTLILLLFVVLLSGCQSQPEGASSQPETPLLVRPLMRLVKDHQQHGTHFDGPRCQMYPSCAGYGEEALRKYSLIGILMLIDRMFYREGDGDQEHKYMKMVNQKGDVRFYDPVDDSYPFHLKRPSLVAEDFSGP